MCLQTVFFCILDFVGYGHVSKRSFEVTSAFFRASSILRNYKDSQNSKMENSSSFSHFYKLDGSIFLPSCMTHPIDWISLDDSSMNHQWVIGWGVVSEWVILSRTELWVIRIQTFLNITIFDLFIYQRNDSKFKNFSHFKNFEKP